MQTGWRGHSWLLQSSYQDQASQISLQEMEWLEAELEGCLGEGRPWVLLGESVRRGVGKKKGCLSKLKESPQDTRPISILLKTL